MPERPRRRCPLRFGKSLARIQAPVSESVRGVQGHTRAGITSQRNRPAAKDWPGGATACRMAPTTPTSDAWHPRSLTRPGEPRLERAGDCGRLRVHHRLVADGKPCLPPTLGFALALFMRASSVPFVRARTKDNGTHEPWQALLDCASCSPPCTMPGQTLKRWDWHGARAYRQRTDPLAPSFPRVVVASRPRRQVPAFGCARTAASKCAHRPTARAPAACPPAA